MNSRDFTKRQVVQLLEESGPAYLHRLQVLVLRN